MTTTTLAPPLTIEVVRDLLNAAVAEKGEDYVCPGSSSPTEDVDSSCEYVVYDEAQQKQVPGCIVGNVLYRAGVPLSVLVRFEGRAADGVLGPDGLGLAADNVVRFGLQEAQETQDCGQTWGQARDRFEAFVKDPSNFDTREA